MTTLSLNGAWEMKEVSKQGWLPARVPGCNYSDLLAAGKIADPFAGDNELKSLWVAQADWEYRRTFQVSELMCKCKQILLCCAQLDTICDVYVNGHLAGKGENSHRFYEFPVKQYLKTGENEIRILFHSPIKYVQEKHQQDRMPKSINSDVDGVPHIRKAQCHFGWDWGPKLPVSGITRDIELRAYEQGRIADVRISQTHQAGKVELAVDYTAELFGMQACEVEIVLTHPDGTVEKKNVPALRDVPVKFLITQPELWWTKELSGRDSQPLYMVETRLITGKKTLDSDTKRIGLRTIQLNRETDKWGRNFQFILNGVPIFAKGGDWIPGDSFINRFTKDKIDYFIECAGASNMNMIRVWGGGYYESDYFYDKCDVCGILVWQDFMFACAPYPFYDEAFLENVRAEVRDNVRRLRHHASLALWCGNNEVESMSRLWSAYFNLKKWTEIFFYHILPELVARYDADTPYIAGSPNGSGYMKDYDKDDYGDTHLWQVWHGLKPLTYYRKRYTRFCSEFGLESFPDMLTLQEYIAPADQTLHSDVMMVHQKCKNGNSKMLYYMASRFRIMKEFQDVVTLTQIIQSEGVRDATEHWRRNRGRCNGSIWWQFNDCWPTGSWASMDYKGRFKVLQYTAKHFLAPVMVSLEDNKSKVQIHLINDLMTAFKGSLRWRAVRFDGTVIHEETLPHVVIPPLCARRKAELNLPVFLKPGAKKDSFLQVDLMDETGGIVSRKIMLFVPENQIDFPAARIQSEIEFDNGLAKIKLFSDTFARFVGLGIGGGYRPFSDNYFDLLPGEEKIVTVPVPAGMSEERLRAAFTVRSLADMEAAASLPADIITRMKLKCILSYNA